MNKRRFSFRDRHLSFRYAFQGIRFLMRNEYNAWIHLFVTIAVLIAGFAFGLPLMEWIAVCFAIGFVFAMEAVNTAIEFLCDFVSPERRELIGRVKDLTAGAVLFAAITAAVIGGLIFIPKIVALF